MMLLLVHVPLLMILRATPMLKEWLLLVRQPMPRFGQQIILRVALVT